jgi:hypothetical protein
VLVKDDDLIAATHGRGFWILDDITPLRQISSQMMSGPAYLFAPQVATRVRWDMNTDTPIPPDYAAGQNPPDGAIIDYYIKGGSGPVTLEILDSGGNVVRRYSSNDRVPPIDPMLAVPKYWARPETALPADAGMHRWMWDMRYAPMPEPTRRDYPMQAVHEDTPVSPTAPWAMPGQYTVRLTAGGQTYNQPLTVRMDPRVKTSQADLQQQFDLAKPLYEAAMTLAPAASQLSSIRAQARQLQGRAQGAVQQALADFDKKAEALGGAGGRGRFAALAGGGGDTVSSVQAMAMLIMSALEEADVAPTTQLAQAAKDRAAAAQTMTTRWQQFLSQDVEAINAQLKQAGLPAINPKAPAPPEVLTSE